jgi:hypothetical protein
VSESLEAKLKAVTAEVTSLEREYDKFLAGNEERVASGVAMTPARQSEGEELQRKLNEARQRQLSLSLLSISESSNRLETATRNLQQSSESQVKVAESQVRVSESQAHAINDLLRSSHRLEQFALFLIILTALSIFIVEQSIAPSDPTLKTVWIVLFIGAILALTAYAYRWPRQRNNPRRATTLSESEREPVSIERRIWVIVSSVGWIIGLIASGLALAQIDMNTASNQALSQPSLQCIKYAFADPVQMEGLNSSYILPHSIVVTLSLLRSNPDFILPLVSEFGYAVYTRIPSQSPQIDATWRYVIHYKFANNNPLLTSIPLTMDAPAAFSVQGNDNVTVKMKVNIEDFTRQNIFTNITVSYDEFFEHYSTYKSTPFEVVRSNHDSRQLNIFMPVYSVNYGNSTLNQIFRYQIHHQRAFLVANLIVDGITSMMSFTNGHFGWCGGVNLTGKDVWE